MRSTTIVHSRLSWRTVRAAAALAGCQGVQVLAVEQAAARLAGGFARPIDSEALKEAIRLSLDSDLSELNDIKSLPGFARAAAATLEKVWAAGIDLAARATAEKPPRQSRLLALAKLEAAALKHIPAAMLRPVDLVGRALKHLPFAKAVLGSVSVQGRTEMSPVWRPLIEALAGEVDVTWHAGPRRVPEWIHKAKISVVTSDPQKPSIFPVSCASPRHEALEAIRWARELMASGRARPEDIAIAAAATDEWDDHFQALTEASGIDLHFVSGKRALGTSEGQLSAALAEVLLRGFSQSRLVRLVAVLRQRNKGFEQVPGHWWGSLPANAPLLSAEDWRGALERTGESGLEDAKAVKAVLSGLIDVLSLGLKRAGEIGEKLLSGQSLAIWQDALIEGPPEALDVTLAALRVPLLKRHRPNCASVSSGMWRRS